MKITNELLLDGFQVCIISALSFILLKMGSTLNYEKKPWKVKDFVIVFTHQYLLDPLYVLILAIILNPPEYQVYGMFVVALTPSTAAASVSVYSVDGDVALAICLCLCSLVQSIIFTPLFFSLMVKIYSINVNKVKGNLEMPYLEMFVLMSYVLFLISCGYLFKIKVRESIVKKIGKICQRLSISLLLIGFVCYMSSGYFIESLTSSNPYGYFGSMILITIGNLTKAHIPICNEKEDKKDAMVLVTFRKSPGISLAIAALSFNGHELCGKIIGYVFVYGLLRDWISMPHLMCLRRKRLGYYLYKKTENNLENIEIEKHGVSSTEIERYFDEESIFNSVSSED